MAVELFANLPSTTVSSGGTTAPAQGTTETWTVASSVTFPAASDSATPPTQFHVADVAANSEIIAVTNVSGTTWTVTRGAESTTPVAHSAGFTVYQVVTAGVLGTFPQSVTAADTSVVIGGTATAPTVRTNTLDVIAADHPAAADWSNNSHKITSLANGSGAQDAAAYGQTPAGGNTATIGQGGTGQTSQQAAINALSGTQATGYVLGSDGTNVTMVPDGGVTIKVPAPTGLTATDTPHVTAAITSLITALGSGPATLLFQDGAYQVDGNALVIRSPNSTTVASASNGAEPSTWTPASQGTLTVASTTGFPSTGSLWLAASAGTTALITYAGTTSTTFTGCVYLSGSATGTLSTGGTVAGVLSNFAVRSAGKTVITGAPNRAGLVNNTTGDLFVIADCTDFRVEGLTLDGMRDTVAPITPLSASASSGQPSVTVASGQGARYLAGQNLYLFGGLGTAEQNQSEGWNGGAGAPLVISSITTGGGSGGGDLITFTTNLANAYAQISATLFSDAYGPYACAGAYLTPYQCGNSNSVAGRTLGGENQQNALHLMNCQRFTVSGVTTRNIWESGIKLGTGSASTSATDGCSSGAITGCTTWHGYDQGYSVWISKGITITGCVSDSSGWAGISFTASDDCTATGNVLSNETYRVPGDATSGCGLASEGGLRNQFHGNIIRAPYYAGIRLSCSSLGWGLTTSTCPTTSAYLTAQTAAGTSVQVSSTTRLQAGGRYSITDGARTEAVTVDTIADGTHVTFKETLQFSHASGVSVTFRVSQENHVEGCTIIAPATGPGIQAENTVRPVISGNVITKCGTSGNYGPGIAMTYSNVLLPSTVYLGGNGAVVAENVIGGCETQAIAADSTDNLTITGNRIYGGAGTSPAIHLLGVTDSLVSGNYVSDVEGNSGIYLQAGTLASTVCARLEIAGNDVTRCAAPGIYVLQGDSLNITGNTVTSCVTNGIEVHGVTRSLISGNTCNSNQSTGIKLTDYNGATGCQYDRIAQNTTRDDGTGKNVTTGATWTQQHGIVEAGLANNNVFTLNESDSNAQDQIVTVGAASYAWANIISGTASGALPLVLGGTSAATRQAAINALTGTQSSGTYLRSDGTNAALAAIAAADLPAATTGTQGAVILDGTASDLLASQYAAYAGVSTKAAAADHIHPSSASSLGIVAWNYPSTYASASTPALTSGVVYLMRIPLSGASITVTNILLAVFTAGSSLTSSQCFAGLYDNTGAKIGGSADQSASWTSTGLKTIALTGGPFTGTWPFAYAVIVTNGTTNPVFPKGGGGGGAGPLLVNLSATGSAIPFATNGTGATALPGSLTYSSNSASASTPQSIWVGLS